MNYSVYWTRSGCCNHISMAVTNCSVTAVTMKSGVTSIDYNHGIKTTLISHWLVLKTSPFCLFWSPTRFFNCLPTTWCKLSYVASLPSSPHLQQLCCFKSRDSHWECIAICRCGVAVASYVTQIWRYCVSGAYEQHGEHHYCVGWCVHRRPTPHKVFGRFM